MVGGEGHKPLARLCLKNMNTVGVAVEIVLHTRIYRRKAAAQSCDHIRSCASIFTERVWRAAACGER